MSGQNSARYYLPFQYRCVKTIICANESEDTHIFPLRNTYNLIQATFLFQDCMQVDHLLLDIFQKIVWTKPMIPMDLQTINLT